MDTFYPNDEVKAGKEVSKKTTDIENGLARYKRKFKRVMRHNSGWIISLGIGLGTGFIIVMMFNLFLFVNEWSTTHKMVRQQMISIEVRWPYRVEDPRIKKVSVEEIISPLPE